jgi:ribosomal protein S18 acetylase RimI-like enzyme
MCNRGANVEHSPHRRKQRVIGRDQNGNRDTDVYAGRFAKGSNRTQIRAAIITDLAAVITCSDLAFKSFAGHSDKVDVKLADNLQPQILSGSIQLICDELHVLGYISLWPAADRMFIDTLAVLPQHHRQGLGSLLLDFADRETLRLGLKSVNLFTKAAMVNNLEFYRRRGYSETGRCDDDGFSRVFYTKNISPVIVAAVSAPLAASNAPASVLS